MSQPHNIEEYYQLKNLVTKQEKYIEELEKKLHIVNTKLSFYESKYSDVLLSDDETDDWSTISSLIHGKSSFSYLLTPAPLPPQPLESLPEPPLHRRRSKSRRKQSLPDTLPSSDTPKPKTRRRKPRASLPAYPNRVKEHHITIIQSFFRGMMDRNRVKTRIEKQIQSRRYAILEVLQAERNYNKILLTILKHYKIPATQSDLFTYSEINRIFMNLDQIYESSQKFLKGLEELFQEDPLVIGHRLGLLFLKMIPEWRDYSFFCNHFDRAMETIVHVKDRKTIKEWFKRMDYSKDVSNLTLPDLLIAPVKRIPQYEILLKAIKKVTPKHSRHYQALRSAKQMVTELAQNMNEKKKEIENLEKLKAIQSSLIGSVPDILNAGREFVDEIVAFEEVESQIHEKRFILFNDCIVLSSVSHRFDRLVYLNLAETIDMNDKKLMIKIDPYTLTMVFHSSALKTRWLNSIKNAIETMRYQLDNSMIRDFIVDTVSPRIIKNYVLKEGYVYKQSKLKSWYRRWFVLEQGFLYYFKSKKTSNKEKGFVDLSMYFIKKDPVNTQESKSRYAFELYSHKLKSIVLSATSQEERETWMNAIRPYLLLGRNINHSIPTSEVKDLMSLEEEKKDPLGLRDSRFYFDEDHMNRENKEEGRGEEGRGEEGRGEEGRGEDGEEGKIRMDSLKKSVLNEISVKNETLLKPKDIFMRGETASNTFLNPSSIELSKRQPDPSEKMTPRSVRRSQSWNKPI